jgi:hypothetical protein
MRLERPFQIARMIVHPELALDQGCDALEGPALGGKARRHGAPVQEPPEAGPGPLTEPRWSSCDGSRLQAAPTLLGEGCSPAADAGATDPQVPGDLGLGEPSLA